MYEYTIIMLTCPHNFTSDSDVFCTVNKTLIHHCSVNNNNRDDNDNDTKCDTKYKSNPSLSGPQQQCTHNEHMVILYSWQQHFVTAACEQILYFNHLYCLVCAVSNTTHIRYSCFIRHHTVKVLTL